VLQLFNVELYKLALRYFLSAGEPRDKTLIRRLIPANEMAQLDRECQEQLYAVILRPEIGRLPLGLCQCRDIQSLDICHCGHGN
jgi:hypothetical protein